MTLTQFEKVCEFNKAFDYKVYNIHEGNPLEDTKIAKYRYSLIHEEGIVELGFAFRNNDRVETMDGIADLLYVLYGACYTYDLNPDIMINNIYGSYIEFNNKIKLDVFNSLISPEEYYQKLLNDIDTIKKSLLESLDIIQLYSVLIKTIKSTFEFSFSLRIDINKVFDIVHKSNMSKLCVSEIEAQETVSFYKTKYEIYISSYEEICNKFGKDSEEAKIIYSPYDTPYYYKSGDYWLVKNDSTGKALKSINYTPVIL
jgi:predicted HAD superfamily Cof-like phosphohydrolase